jgi:hypothetical protein
MTLEPLLSFQVEQPIWLLGPLVLVVLILVHQPFFILLLAWQGLPLLLA